MAFDSESDLEDELVRETSSALSTLGGIVFTSSFSGNALAPRTKYKIRLPALQV